MKRGRTWGIVATLAFGCGGGSVATPELADESSSTAASTETTETSGVVPSSSSSTGDAVESSSGESSSTGEDPGPSNIPPPATGIQIVHVTADQGVRVLVARDGELVGGAERTTPLLRNRRLILRAFYEVDEGFADRDLYGVLTVTQADGRITEYENFVTAYDRPCEDGTPRYDCGYGSLASSFFWLVEPADVQPGVRYHIELFEVRPGHEHDVSDKIPVFPTHGGSLPIGVEESYQKMRVVLVPFDHDIGENCPEPPDLLEEFGEDVYGNPRNVAKYFADRLLAENPADEVEVIPHEVRRYTGSLRGSQLLQTLQQLRFAEDAPPEYYYYGVARPCDGGPDFAGVAQLGGPSRGAASQRVGWGVYYQSVSGTAGTFVHEIGHEQGRAHIACSGEAGPDPSYPDHPNGRLLSWGTDVISNQIAVHDPADHDYMTYCDSTWVSEWGYNLVLPAIAEISTWELEGHGGEEKRNLLVGNVNADGTQQWYLTRGYAPATTHGDTQLRLHAGGSTFATTPAMSMLWERSEDYNVIAPLPDDLRRVDALEIEGPAGKFVLDPKTLPVVGPHDLRTAAD